MIQICIIKKGKDRKERELHKNTTSERRRERSHIARIFLLTQERADKKQKLPSGMVKV